MEFNFDMLICKQSMIGDIIGADYLCENEQQAERAVKAANVVGFHKLEEDDPFGVGFVVTEQSAEQNAGYWVFNIVGDYELNEDGMYDVTLCNPDAIDTAIYYRGTFESIEAAIAMIKHILSEHEVTKHINYEIETNGDGDWGVLQFTAN